MIIISISNYLILYYNSQIFSFISYCRYIIFSNFYIRIRIRPSSLSFFHVIKKMWSCMAKRLSSFNRQNSRAIDYSNFPIAQERISRVEITFYPWFPGSPPLSCRESPSLPAGNLKGYSYALPYVYIYCIYWHLVYTRLGIGGDICRRAGI